MVKHIVGMMLCLLQRFKVTSFSPSMYKVYERMWRKALWRRRFCSSVHEDLQIISVLHEPDVSNLHRSEIIEAELQCRKSNLIF